MCLVKLDQTIQKHLRRFSMLIYDMPHQIQYAVI